ncbi:MAG: UDP-N-acetyl-D-mannosamine dehydrogenase, partial [Rhodospirillales bacterium]|nr:UDP-N-acetyl-D-mannosamine dehydrogenase [Rhodospirillales bacterium]
ASRGVQVMGIDKNKDAVALINEGRVPIVEPDLDTLVLGAVGAGNLRAVTKPEPADAFIIAVPTPFTDDHKPDLSYLEAAARELAPVLVPGNLVVLESTSPPGTTENLAQWLARDRADLSFPHQAGDQADIHLAHSPERVLPGHILRELVENDRVIGGMTTECAARAERLYGLFVNGQCYLTDSATAELVKLAENAYRDTNIAFANELATVCEKLDMDVWRVLELANHHPRVNILQPGPGVGGHCIAVDPWFIVDAAPDETPLIQTVRAINDGRPAQLVEKVLAAAKDGSSTAIACLGLAYKADLDDLRQSPAIDAARLLADEFKGELLVVEPNIQELPAELAGRAGMELCDLDRALEQAEIIVLLTDHREFRSLDCARLAGKIIFDSRGIWR